MKKLSVFLYGLISYLLFMGTFVYLIGFLADVSVPKSVDSGGELPLLPSLLIDIGLILLFGVQHSLMARSGFKNRLMKYIPKAAERSTYVLASTLVLILLIVLWQPIPVIIWDFQSTLGKASMYGLYGAGILGILITSFQLNHFDLFGLRQVYLYLLDRDYRHPEFVRSFLYRWVRNPMHTATITFFLATPRLTLGHLVLSIGMTVYTLIGIRYEERDLAHALGEIFHAYSRRTPSLLPNPFQPRQQKESRSVSPCTEQV
jgi:protein-S-isoprenylcysteine O-methyltransferase Ste14